MKEQRRTLNVITKNLAVALSSSLSESLQSQDDGQLTLTYNNDEQTDKSALAFPPLPRPDIVLKSVEEGKVW